MLEISEKASGISLLGPFQDKAEHQNFAIITTTRSGIPAWVFCVKLYLTRSNDADCYVYHSPHLGQI